MYSKTDLWIKNNLVFDNDTNLEDEYKHLGAAVLHRAIEDAVGQVITNSQDVTSYKRLRKDAFKWIFSNDQGLDDRVSCIDWCDYIGISHSRLCRHVAERVEDFSLFYYAVGSLAHAYSDIIGTKAA